MTPDQRLIATMAGWLLAVAALVAGGAWAGYSWRDRAATADLAECQRVHAEAMATLLRAANQAESEYRAKEQAWEAKKQEIVQDAQAKIQAQRAGADRLRRALDRLRHASAAPAGGSGAAADPSAAAGSQAAIPAADLPADLSSRVGEAAGAIARFADESHAAGLTCEALYRAVETPRLGR